MANIKVKTESGFECEIRETIKDDMRVIDALVDVMEEENALNVSKLASLVLGKEKERLYKFVARDDGSVPVSLVVKNLTEIFNSAGEDVKNS